MDLQSGRERGLLLQVLTAVLLLSVHSVCGITEAGLLPFGTGPPELTLPTGDNVAQDFGPAEPFMYAGMPVQEIKVTTDGLISLNQDTAGTILVFGADVDTRAAGNIHYGLRNDDLGVLEDYIAAAAAIDSRFAGCYDRVFIATWDSVGYHDQNNDPLNTFQGHIVYSSTSEQTLVILLYPENGINWTTGDDDGGTNGLGGTQAIVGLTSQAGSLLLPESLTPAIVDIESLTNVGIPGVFVYRVDADLLQPDPLVGGTDVVCEITSVSGSASGVPPSGSTPDGCMEAGFTTCCVPNVNESCVVNVGTIDECSCDVDCFVNATCCVDITQVPCLPDIFVGFVPQNYTVGEGAGYVTLNVSAYGFPGAPYDDMVDNISVLLVTADGTAEAGMDFDGVIRELLFSSDGSWEVMVRILDNSPVELTEFFLGNLSTDNPFVVFNNNVATVEIIDDDRLFVRLEDPIDSPESALSADVCVSVVSGVLQAGVQAVVTVNVVPNDPEDSDDFGAGPFDLVFDSGDTIQCEPVPIRVDTILEGNETFSIFIADTSMSPMVTVSDTDPQDIVIIDSTEGTISLDGIPGAVVESTGRVEVCAVIGNVQLERDVVASLTTTPLSASDPADYAGGVFPLFFESPNTRQCANISIVVDAIFEADETFLVIVSTDDPAIQPSLITTAPVIIVDETEIPFDFTDALGVYFESEGDVATVCVTVLGNLDRDVTLTLTTSDITAISPFDYLPISVDLLFNAGASVVCTDIPLLEDNVVEFSENINISLSSEDPEVRFVRDTAEVFIIDATKVDIGFERDEYVIVETVGSVMVCVQQTSFPPVIFLREVALTFNTIPDTAVEQMDYTPVENRVIVFPSTRCISIDINDDAIFEPDEMFSVVVSSNDAAAEFSDDEATVTIREEDAMEPIGIEFEEYRFREGAIAFQVCVVANGVLTQDVRIFLLSEDGSATSGTGSPSDDYLAVSEDLTLFAGNFPRACISVIILDDGADENVEFFTIQLTNQDSWPQFRSASTVFIEDDDEDISFDFTEETGVYFGPEGGVARVCVEARGNLDRDVILTLTTSDDIAIASDDYIPMSAQLLFNAGVREACTDIPILVDNIVEFSESFNVFLSSTDPNVVLVRSRAQVFAVDATTVDLGFEQDEYVVLENAGSVTVCVQQTSFPNVIFSRGVILVFNTIPGTAVAPMDFTPVVNDAIIFPFERCIDIDINDDDILELSDERFSVVVRSSDSAAEFSDDDATVTIREEDMVPIGIEFPDYPVGEGDGGVQVCVVANGLLPQNVQIVLRSDDGTATSGTGSPSDDYVAVSDGLTLFAGNFPRACIPVTILDDAADENEEFFTIRLMNQNSWPQFRSTSTVRIGDNDQVIVSFVPPDYTVNEAAGLVRVCVSLDRPLERNGVEVDISTTDNSAESGSDYTGISQTVTFNSGDGNMCVDIPILEDTLVEGPEVFFVDLVYSTEAGVISIQSTVTIEDNDVVPDVTLSLEQASYVVTETDASQILRVCVVAAPAVTTDGVNVFITSGDFEGEATAGTDYETVGAILTFNTGDTSRCEDVTILGDTVLEGTERFLLFIASGDADIGQSNSVVTILDDDEPVGDPVFGFENAQGLFFGEAAGDVQVCVIVVSGTVSRNTPVAVRSGQSGDSAQVGRDYLNVIETLFFTPGGPDRMCLTVTIIDDIRGENDETFTLILNNRPNRPTATVTINDNDPVSLLFTQASYTVNEGEDLTVSVVANRPFEIGPFFVTIVSVDGTAQSVGPFPDYVAVNEQRTLTSSQSVQSVTISANSDQFLEFDEQFELQLRDSNTLATLFTATVVIRNVGAGPVFGFENAQGLVFIEAAGDVQVCVIVESGTVSENTLVIVRSGQSGDSAQVGGDYRNVVERLIFTPGGPTRMCLTVTIVNDAIEENTETFTLLLNSQPAATIAIIDDDDIVAQIGFERAFYVVSEEAEVVQVCVVISEAVNGIVTVDISTADGTAMAGSDYVPLPFPTTLTFPANVIRMCNDIDITNDNMGEPAETFFVQLTNSNLEISRSQATVTILQDQDGEVLVTLQEPIMAVDEGRAIVPVCVDFLGTTLARQIIVTVSTSSDTAIDGVDFIGESTGITYLTTIPQVIICENITIIDDGLAETIEIFRVMLSSTDPAVTFLISQGIVIIVDDDEPLLSAGFVQTDILVQETDENQLTSARLRAFVNGRIVQPVTLQISIVGGTATVGNDYLTANGVLVFNSNADNARREFYTVIGDNVIEDDETILFQLSSQNVPILQDRASAVVTIVNDDSLPPVLGTIVLGGNTPEVTLEPGQQTASVRVAFTLSGEAFTADCALVGERPPVDCSQGAFTFTGLPANRQPPHMLEITARNQLGQVVAVLSRPVRLGFNGDCAVNFVNGMQEAQVSQGRVVILFSPIGPVTSTECRLDNGNFSPCQSPVQFGNLSVGPHRVRVRPNGANCVRRIRRTVEFTVV